MTSANAALATGNSVAGFDEDFVREALRQASMNVLRTALLQTTGDPELAAIPTVESPIRGGALIAYVVPPEYHDMIRAKAFEWLRDNAGRPASTAAPSREAANALMEVFAGQPLTPEELRYGYEELGFDEYPRDATWIRRPPEEKLEACKVVIIGAGISGIAASIQLRRLGIPFELYERGPDIGGTWLINNYPEARVDTSSYLYQFKFEKNYPWTEYFAARDETLRYLNHVVNRHGVRDAMTFDTEAVAATWEEDRAKWSVTLRRADGGDEVVEADILISAGGLFNKPKYPDIAGIETFRGAMFHTTQWDPAFDVRGKKVALIGTGSTGAQLCPRIAEDASHLTIFQRTPEWVMAFENYKASITPEIRWLFDNMPYYWNWYCFSSHLTGQTMQSLQYHDPDWQRQGGRINPRNDAVRQTLLDYISSKIDHDPELLKRLTPPHAPLVRRLVVDNGFYDTIMRDNVEFVSGGISRITPTGIVSDDGTEREFDLIILGTGFETSQYLWPVQYKGRNGTTLEDLWSADGARSYLGITMPDFPNFFIFYGPNGSPRSGGFYSWAEIWARYISQAVMRLIESGQSRIEVKRTVFEQYNARMDEAMKNLIWESEGASYYVNEHGRSGIFMPWETHEYHAMVADIDLDDFELR